MPFADLQNHGLTLFLTRGSTLSKWAAIGTLERETAIYKKLQSSFRSVTFVSYGGVQENRYRQQLKGMRVLKNRWGLSQKWYVRLLIWFAPLFWKGTGIFKSNQVQGAEIALRVANRLDQPFVARCGYLYSYLTEQRLAYDSPAAKEARKLERFVFSNADSIIVTTDEIRELITRKYQLSDQRICVVPNYVETGVFYPNSTSNKEERICYVGRLHEEKNLLALINAVEGLDVELVIVGDGQLYEDLGQSAFSRDLSVQFTGQVPNRTLPEILNASDVFILPSFYEGHPKVLLEAMACGLPVIGTDVTGIRELIDHRVTGYLCGTAAGEIREAIQEVLGDRELQRRMGKNARDFVLENFSLESVLQKELNVYFSIINA